METNAQKLLNSMPLGQVLRRAVLASRTTAVDRDLKKLEEGGFVRKIGPGMYYRPQMSRFGPQPATPKSVVREFLNDDRFLLINPSDYNALGLGLTQLHNFTWVYNRKRFGDFELGSQTYRFRRPPDFPHKVSKSYLLVDLLNNLRLLGEDEETVKASVMRKLGNFDVKEVLKSANLYGKVWVKKFLHEVFEQ